MKIIILVVCLILFGIMDLIVRWCGESKFTSIVLGTLAIVIIILLLLISVDVCIGAYGACRYTFNYIKDHRVIATAEKEEKVEIVDVVYNPVNDKYEYTLLMPEGYKHTLILKSTYAEKINTKFITIRYLYKENFKGQIMYSDIRLR